MAFTESQGLWTNVESIIFTVTSENSKRNLALPTCHGHLLAQSFASSGCRNCLDQYEDHSGSPPHSFPGL